MSGTGGMLELRSLDAGYGSFQALFGVNLDVKAGEAVGVIGPNGAGKTTLMRVISGLIRPTKGTIAMEGTDVLATPAHRIVSLGIAHVPENRRLFPRLTVEDNLKMGAFMPEARAKFSERLEVVFTLFPRMKERRHQMAGTLSGGEQQMCAIGRALMSDPKLLLLDEPSAGLAPVVVQQVFELLKRIRAGGLTVLIVEQNVQQVLRVVDRAYLLEAGTMSGGEQQMCAIGRALMSDPKLLLLDEPSAGLAPVVVQQVFELVKRIRASGGLTVLIVEQNVQQVLRVVDRAYLLEAGSIRASGSSDEMLANDTIREAYLGV